MEQGTRSSPPAAGEKSTFNPKCQLDTFLSWRFSGIGRGEVQAPRRDVYRVAADACVADAVGVKHRGEKLNKVGVKLRGHIVPGCGGALESWRKDRVKPKHLREYLVQSGYLAARSPLEFIGDVAITKRRIGTIHGCAVCVDFLMW